MEDESTLKSSNRGKIHFKSSNHLKMEKILIIVCFLAVPLTLLILFTYVPLVDMIRFSMYHYKGFTDTRPVFVAFGSSNFYADNYATIFSDSSYWLPFKVSLFYLMGSLIQIVIALYFATIFYFRPKGAKFFKAIIFIPSLLNGVAISLMWLLIFRSKSDGGVLNSIISNLGGNTVDWFGTYVSANMVLVFVSVWRYLGNNMVMFAGSMESINRDEIEASTIDGANKWQQFIHIILPSTKKVVFLNLILAINGAVQAFEIPYIMQPSNYYTQTFIMKTVNLAFTGTRDVGLASALGIVMLIIVSLIALCQKAVENKMED